MIDIFTAFCDILVYPLYHISDDAYIGILFYLLIIFFNLHLLLYAIFLPVKKRKVRF